MANDDEWYGKKAKASCGIPYQMTKNHKWYGKEAKAS